MIDSYWDLYVAYIDYCVRYNYENDIDPYHYRMEWNHFLPKTVFGDWPIGQYLLLRQHAIASALQTLAFHQKCLCGWHVKYLPHSLWELVRPYYQKGGRIHGKMAFDKKAGAHSEDYRTSGKQREINKRQRQLGIGIYNSATKEKVKKICSKPVMVFYPSGEIKVYTSAKEASREIGMPQGNLSRSARSGKTIKKGKYEGYRFIYV